ncbi:thioredoxin-like protein [Rhodocollybia butyracea]|uniref:Thioredoxin-like protein n=1 Tax=Rhodocollybia butyracea TaxID=206335 RepID=A0A9P5Q2F2_9AGAR|nr:thioredoxin-like protein [Rhodocollybia butyracea]
MAQLTGSPPIRRSRLVIIILALACFCLYTFSDSLFSDFDTENRVLTFVGGHSWFGSSALKKSSVDEIYGLISLVTRDSDKSQRVLTEESIDLTHKLDLDVYASHDGIEWGTEMLRLNREYPVVVFSKTYCPYSRKAKQLLETYQLSPPPKIIEVDLRDDSASLKTILTRLTRRSTFPNILVKGESIGGSDDLQALHSANALKAKFEDAGVKVRSE